MVSPRKRQKVYDPPRFVGRPRPDVIAKTTSLLAKVERQSGVRISSGSPSHTTKLCAFCFLMAKPAKYKKKIPTNNVLLGFAW